MLEIPPSPGRTIIPRSALVVEDGHFYAFVRLAEQPDKFARRRVAVAQEKDSLAIVDRGLEPGEEVVSVGALILAQLYEDSRSLRTGTPLAAEAGEE